MATPENNKPQPIPDPRLESVAPPARVTDGIHAVDVTKRGDTLWLRVSKGEQAIFTAALLPENQVQMMFGVGTDASLPETTTFLATGETNKAPEHPPITIEGFPVRITGDDVSYTKKHQGKPDRVVHKIQADSVEKIKDRLDSPDILHEKVRLADLQE